MGFFLDAGHSLLQTLVIVFSLLGLGVLIEIAYRRIAEIPSPSRWNRVFNCKCTAVVVIFQGTIELILFMPLFWLAFKFGEKYGPLFSSRPGITFALLMALLASIVGDFFYYWFHRLCHISRWFWPMHELHHEDEHMNVTTAFRFHWVESITQGAVQVLPAALLPRPMVVIPILFFMRYARTLFEHLAIPLHLGPVVTSPATHRLHHSVLPEHFNKNFAAVWPFWDVIFGTYCSPKRGEYPPTGLLSGKVSKNLKEAFWGPLEVKK
jgi:sterol desaturase/sphingolipid hydroxylase (fatty acid hydroxylase superfamily)